MKKAIAGVLGFVIGAAAGSAASWYILRTRYEQIAQDEIDSVKEVFSKKMAEANKIIKEGGSLPTVIVNKKEDKMPKAEEFLSETETVDYSKIAERYSVDKSVNEKTEEEKKNPYRKIDVPYVVSPDEFGEFEDYETIELTFYADKVLADDDYDIVEDVDEVVGFESLSHFGDYAEDVVYVRNDRLKCDYEVVRDHRKYLDVMRETPYRSRGVL